MGGQGKRSMTKDAILAKMAAAETRYNQGDEDAYQEILYWQGELREAHPVTCRKKCCR